MHTTYLLLTVHHWYDVLAGGIIGTVMATIAFRQTFAAVFDFRFNHLLLPRTTSLFHRTPYFRTGTQFPFFTYQPSPEFMSVQLPFTREGGWGWGQESYVGAPGDATSLGTGVMGHIRNGPSVNGANAV